MPSKAKKTQSVVNPSDGDNTINSILELEQVVQEPVVQETKPKLELKSKKIKKEVKEEVKPDESKIVKNNDIIKKKKTNKIIFEKSAIEIANTLNDENFKKKFLDFLNKMHNLLRGCAVTGDPALDDILNTLFLCYIEDRILDKGIFDFENSEKECYETIRSKIKEYSKYLKVSYLLEHIEEFKKNEGQINSISKCGKIFKLHPTTKLLFKDDNFINCPDPVIFSKLLRECKAFSKEQNIFENIDIAGIAYEYMTTKHAGNGGMSKEMGQYFTERPLMWILFQLFDLKDINDLGIDNNSTIGDEFCATFGFPLMTRNFLKEKFNIDIQEKNMYGVEYHERLSRFAIMNAMFSMKNFENITRGDSFITNVTPHLDLSIHNVPFGKSMIPENIKKTYTKFLEENPNKGYPELKDYIPFCNKKIDAILASQVVLYKTKKMGLMIIKDGEETSGKSNADYRKYFSENCIIKKIIKIPCDAFTCTKTKTICIYFIKKEGKMTENIQFLELIDNGNKINEVCNVSMDDLKKNNYAWDSNAYILDEEMEKIMAQSKCEWKKLGDNINFLQKSKRDAKYGNEIGKYPFFKSSNIISAYVDIPDYTEESIIIGDGGKPNINYGIKFSASNHCIIFNSNNNLLLNKWIHYYIKFNLNILNYTGAGIENISKDDIKNIMIPIPSIEIQNEIVQMLDNLSQQKQFLNDRKNGINIQIEYYFKNQIKKNKDSIKIEKLEKITNIDIGSTPSTINDEYWINGSHIWLSVGELNNNLIPITNSKKKLTEKAIQDCNLTLAKSGTILMSFKLSIGKLGIAGCDLYTNEAILHINTNNNELNRYLYYHILSISINNTATGSMGEAGSLNKDKLKVLDMFIQTDKIKQKEIVDYLDKLENKKNSIDDELKDIDNLMKSILEQSYE
jgi:type I restriction enzyme S subunit